MKYVPLKGVSSIGYATTNNLLQDSLIEYFDYALLDKGNYFNVTKGETAFNGSDYSRLRLSSHDQYASGQVWEGFRSNWVWQSGINPSGHEPPIVGDNIAFQGISGVYVDDEFHPTSGVGPFSHHVDYFNGRVIFDSSIDTSSVVQAEFSYKYINVVYANSVPWLREVQTRTRYPTSDFLDTSKGKWDIPPEARLQLPAIAIEIAPQRKFKGYQLGGGQWIYTDIIFHCIAEDEYTRNQLIDIVSLQNDKTLYLLNLNQMSDADDYPLDYRGVPVSGAKTYPELIEQYGTNKVRVINTVVEEMIMLKADVFGGIVKTTAELIKTNI